MTIKGSAWRRKCITVPGPLFNAMAELTKKYGIYVLYGLAERDINDPTKVYNSAAICGPEGVIGTYRKIHLPFSEMNWADRGSSPVLFETPWGPAGVGICYDTYCFPEIMRYCRAMGSRLFINCSAIGTEESGGAGGYYGNLSLEYLSSTNDMFIATANLYDKDVTTYFMGGSSIIGPSSKPPHIHYYTGQKFLDPGADEGTVATATIDLSCVESSFLNSLWEYNESIDSCDWRPELYSQWYEKIVSTDFGAKPKNNHYISK